MRHALTIATVLSAPSTSLGVIIHFNGTPPGFQWWNNPPGLLDINTDGIPDIQFYAEAASQSTYSLASYRIQPLNGTAVAVVGSSHNLLNTLPGTLVNGSLSYYGISGTNQFQISYGYSSDFPKQGHVKSSSVVFPSPFYLGFYVPNPAGLWNYGWLHISASAGAGWASAQLLDYAYESQITAPIIVGAVPAPGSIIMFAAGTIIASRRPRRAPSASSG